ncbi:MAG: SMC-Scp complex subunit ScpB [Deltaproteobacteria bacterium]|nr:SMC-Scp complex subunit ScpB [Deltaproteobacteria bacterium]
MEINELKPILESMIFASEEPLTLNAITLVFQETGIEKKKLEEALESLAKDYNDDAVKGLMLRQVSGGWQFATKQTVADWIQKLNIAKPRSLSHPALETLAVIAYRQPVIRSEIETIRGVDTGGVLKTLLERGLIKIMGRKEEAGQPLIYGTTPAFLELFHLNRLEELPSMKEIEQMVEATAPAAEGEELQVPGVEAEWEVDEVLEGAAPLGLVGGADDGEALNDLENSIKELRRLEKEMFPKEEGAAVEGAPEGTLEESPATVQPEGPSEPEL